MILMFSVVFLASEIGIQHPKMNSKHWYAIYTKSRTEKKVHELMCHRGFDSYLPLIKTMRQWTDRKKKVEVPLIASYIFVHVNEKEYYNILNTPGAVAYVTFEGKAAKIPEQQINAMRAAVDNNLSIELDKECIKPGEKVRVIAGPLKGAEGEFVAEAHKRNFIINMHNIGFALRIEISANDVVKI